ncbi:MAG: hypothetical protein ACKPE1_18650, partial [Dolichospermum sp.]
MSITETRSPVELPLQHPDISDSVMPVFLEGSEMLGESVLLDDPEQPTNNSKLIATNNDTLINIGSPWI